VEPAISLFQEWKERADFLHVYIMEAHACDEWPLGTKTCIRQHKSTEERIKAAQSFTAQYTWPIPMVVDTISNEFHDNFSAWPERVFVVEDGKMTFIAHAGEDGYDFLWPGQVREFFRARK